MFAPNEREIFSTRVVVESDQGIAIIQRAPTGEFKGAWELPGGKVDPDEDLFTAALRETKEELGIDVDFVNYHPELIEDRVIPDGKHKGKSFHSYGFVAVALSDDTQLSPEHVDIRWIGTKEQLDSHIVTPTSHNTIQQLGHLLYTRII
jgi:8-oxo-dGTP pyrophosphatase MutT (NUDIX family)